MKAMNRLGVPVFVASVLGGMAVLLGPGSSAAADVGPEQALLAATSGVVGAGDAGSEAVAFDGQASISGRVIYDTTFGGPPVLQLIIDLSRIKGRGMRTGAAYLVSSQAILHRPLQAFDAIELTFSFAPAGNVLLARSGLASFGVRYNAASGIAATPVRVTTQAPD